MYQLILSLKAYSYQYSVYPFGEFVHYSDTRADFDPKELIAYLETENLSKIVIEQTVPTIEDTFMELAR